MRRTARQLAVLLAASAFVPSAHARPAHQEFHLAVAPAYSDLQSGGLVTARVSGAIGIRWLGYLRPVEEDATPFALQPFLQRASWGAIAVEGSASALSEPSELASGEREISFAADGELYLRRWLSVGLFSRYRDSVGEARSGFGGGLGLRLGDLQLTLGGEGGFLHRRTSDRLEGRLTLDLRVVALEHLDIALGARAHLDALDAYLQTVYYPSPRLGLLGGGYGGGARGPAPIARDDLFAAHPGPPPLGLDDAGYFGCLLGASYWASSRLAAQVTYSATWVSGHAGGVTDQRLLITLSSRR